MTAQEEIVPGVFGVLKGFGNAFILVDDEVTLIDTGLARRLGKLTAAVSSIGREITNIALTHHHFDHMGCLSRLGTDERRIFAHPLDADVVRGDRAIPGLSVGGARKLVLTVLRPVLFGGDPPRCRVDREILEGDEIPGTGGLRAVHTPGHTPGHLSFIHPSKRILFVGRRCCEHSAARPPAAVHDRRHGRGEALARHDRVARLRHRGVRAWRGHQRQGERHVPHARRLSGGLTTSAERQDDGQVALATVLVLAIAPLASATIARELDRVHVPAPRREHGPIQPPGEDV